MTATATRRVLHCTKDHQPRALFLQCRVAVGRFVGGTGRALLLAASLLPGVPSAWSFPLNQFKAFVNEKPTIEGMEFRMRGIKYQVGGLDASTFREFHLTYQGITSFSLVEDRTIPAFVSATNAGGWPTIRFSGRFGDEYWHSLNAADVIVGSASNTAKQREMTQRTIPFPVAKPRLALDLLNLGIFDLGTNRIEWAGLTFSCPSNSIGANVLGTLEVTENNIPVGMEISYSLHGSIHRYRVTYGFDTSRPLPEFFPANIRVDYLDDAEPRLFCEYDVLTARLSARVLNREEVTYERHLQPESRHFLFTNGTAYWVHGHERGAPILTPVLRGDEPSGWSTSSRLLFVMGVLLAGPLIVYIFRRCEKLSAPDQL